ncbi:MAG: hypothetical protein WAM19_07325, partial [Nitrososphaeraceae archaeon]
MLNRIKVPKAYQYRIKSDIKKKLKTFTEWEIPLLIQKGMIANTDLSKYTQNLRISPQTSWENISQL